MISCDLQCLVIKANVSLSQGDGNQAYTTFSVLNIVTEL